MQLQLAMQTNCGRSIKLLLYKEVQTQILQRPAKRSMLRPAAETIMRTKHALI